MKTKKIKYITGSVLTLLLIVTVFFAMKASSEGEKLITLEDKAYELQSENQDLNTQIVTSSSLTAISKTASSSGLITPEKFVYMNGTGVAMR